MIFRTGHARLAATNSGASTARHPILDTITTLPGPWPGTGQSTRPGLSSTGDDIVTSPGGATAAEGCFRCRSRALTTQIQQTRQADILRTQPLQLSTESSNLALRYDIHARIVAQLATPGPSHLAHPSGKRAGVSLTQVDRRGTDRPSRYLADSGGIRGDRDPFS
jgi:hypothetical protein